MEEGTTGTITWGNNKTSKVKVKKIKTYPSSWMPNDYVLTYDENETHKPLIHPLFDNSFIIPEGLMNKVFKED